VGCGRDSSTLSRLYYGNLLAFLTRSEEFDTLLVRFLNHANQQQILVPHLQLLNKEVTAERLGNLFANEVTAITFLRHGAALFSDEVLRKLFESVLTKLLTLLLARLCGHIHTNEDVEVFRGLLQRFVRQIDYEFAIFDLGRDHLHQQVDQDSLGLRFVEVELLSAQIGQIIRS